MSGTAVGPCGPTSPSFLGFFLQPALVPLPLNCVSALSEESSRETERGSGAGAVGTSSHRLLKIFRHFGVRLWGRVPAAGPACRMVAKERRALAHAALESCLVPPPKPAPGPARGTLGHGGCHESCPLQGRHPAGLRCSLYRLGYITVCNVYVGWLMYAFLL